MKRNYPFYRRKVINCIYNYILNKYLPFIFFAIGTIKENSRYKITCNIFEPMFFSGGYEQEHLRQKKWFVYYPQ